MAVLVKDMSLDQFLGLPEEEPGFEYEDGRITQKVSPQGQHGRVQLGLGALIDQFGIPRKAALAFSELRATYGDRSYVPDLSIYRWSRLSFTANGKVANKQSGLPDFVVEIVSPDQSVTALVRHCLWYVPHGVGVALLIDPDDESVLSFRPNQVTASLMGSDRIDLDDLLPGFGLTVQAVFDLLRVE